MLLVTSTSPRRRALLEQIGFEYGVDFKQFKPVVGFMFGNEGETLTLEDVKQKSIQAAREKVTSSVTRDLALKYEGCKPEGTVVLGADTIVFFEGMVLDVPLLVDVEFASDELIREGKQRARQMLSMYSGKELQIITGLVAVQGDNLENEQATSVVTRAFMKQYSKDDIEAYISTLEPLDKAGALGIQERGVVLFDRIIGSYSNIVGLPLVELSNMLHHPYFKERVNFRISKPSPKDLSRVLEGPPELRVLSIGDINYDLAFHASGLFSDLRPPGKHVNGNLYRAAGGTGVMFARNAYSAGFRNCSVLGVIGRGPLGRQIEEELQSQNIRTLLPTDHTRETSIALVIRNEEDQDTALTITDSHQSLTKEDVHKAQSEIERADVLFVSGYCLVDTHRREATREAMKWAHAGMRKHNPVVVLDVTVNMDKAFDFDAFIDMIRFSRNGKMVCPIDVLVAEIPTILGWLGEHQRSEEDWGYIQETVMPRLRKYFPVVLLRTSSYSHEVIANLSSAKIEIHELDYDKCTQIEKIGYADRLTAKHLYSYMSPRLLVASASPRRRELLCQVVAQNKIEIMISHHQEAYIAGESPRARVQRLACEKARQVLENYKEKNVNHSALIKLVLGADTEIVLNNEPLGLPRTDDEARNILRRLSGTTHSVLSGFALIEVETQREYIDCVETLVKFKELSQDDIEAYVSSGEPIGKAGAYGIQGKGSLFVEYIDGSYSNVVGLPLEQLAEVFSKEFGLPIWHVNKVSNWSY